MRIRQFLLFLGLALLLAAALPTLAASSAAAPAAKEATHGLNGTELAILRIKAQLGAHTPARGSKNDKRLIFQIAAWLLAKWTYYKSGCSYGYNCGETCSTAVYGSGLKIFGLLSPWQKKVMDDLDGMCYQRDICRYQQQQNPSTGVCSDVMGCQSEITTCDKPLYDRCHNIIIACPWWTLCYWARKTAAALAIKHAMAARLLWAGVNVAV